ncbi:MAG: dTDP-glucose 4,6-dehydratase [Pirellulales bacterium]|nr:dTDP-glucose 4,6-dehydratase [Pirellulales bacterium]
MNNANDWLLVTGGAGFIGSNFVKNVAAREVLDSGQRFLIADALTYAGHYPNIATDVENNPRLEFVNLDIRHAPKVQELFESYRFSGVLHFAAESHVDRSIENPNIYVETNVLGTLNLLNQSLHVSKQREDFRFLQVGTDEVYGSLAEEEPAFTEENPLRPNSPYSASKAAGDLLARSFFETYQLPVIITRCSNNYGPFQYPEKLIPLMIDRALHDSPLPLYGTGQNIRDWIYVDDHNEGVWTAYQRGAAGEVYNFGGASQERNLHVVKKILKILKKSEDLIEFVPDRPGHDHRYAMDFSKAQRDLGWSPTVTFQQGLEKTVDWYLSQQGWMEDMKKKVRSP